MSYCNNKEYDARRMKDHEAEDRAGDTKEYQEALIHLQNVICAFSMMEPLRSDYEAVNEASLWLQKRVDGWREVCQSVSSPKRMR